LNFFGILGFLCIVSKWLLYRLGCTARTFSARQDRKKSAKKKKGARCQNWLEKMPMSC